MASNELENEKDEYIKCLKQDLITAQFKLMKLTEYVKTKDDFCNEDFNYNYMEMSWKNNKKEMQECMKKHDISFPISVKSGICEYVMYYMSDDDTENDARN
jgi:hypothetical protein